MRRYVIVAGVLGTVLLGGAALAQQPPQHGGPEGTRPGRPGMMQQRGGGMMPGMMEGGMGGAAQGGLCATLVGAPMPADGKAMGRMLQLCGEMLRAVGEVMVKHGQKLEGAGQ